MFVTEPNAWLVVVACGLAVCLLAGFLLGRARARRQLGDEMARAAALVADAEVTARLDPQTAVWNRLGFEECYNSLRDGRRRSDWPVSLVLLDIDDLKSANDTHGHVAGDRLLGCLSHLLSESIREQDEVGRLGGDEFAILLPGTSQDDAIGVAERIRTDVAAMRVPMGETEWSTTISCGVIAVERGESLESAVDRADKGLYHAKQHGRNRVAVRGDALRDDGG